MRRLVALLAVPLLVVLAGCGGDDDDTDAAAPTTEAADVAPTAPAGPPADLCVELDNAINADSPEARQAAFAELHNGLATASGDVHAALFTLEQELGSPQDGEAMNEAMTVLNTELRCGG